MSDFFAGIAIILLMIFAVVGFDALVFEPAEKRECEKNLPRNVQCVLAPPQQEPKNAENN